MDKLHARIGEESTYVLLVVAANETARRFYARRGLIEERQLPDGRVFFRESMGVRFPPGGDPVPALVLRRQPAATLAAGDALER
jgi:hypothetical protein